MDSGGVVEPIKLLVTSENRREILRAVCTDGPIRRVTIERRVDASRRTVKRALDVLADGNYVHWDGDQYRPTVLGRHVWSTYASMEESLALSGRLEPVLGRIPDDAFDLDTRHLSDATIRTAEDGGPYLVLERVLELRRNARKIRALSSVVEERGVHQLRDRLAEGPDLDIEFVLTADAAARAADVDAYKSAHHAVLEADAVEEYAYDGSFPFLLGIFDETVAISADEDGLPDAMIESDDPAVREWAEETFVTYREAAKPIFG